MYGKIVEHQLYNLISCVYSYIIYHDVFLSKMMIQLDLTTLCVLVYNPDDPVRYV